MIHPDSPFVSTVRVNRARMGGFDRVLAISAHGQLRRCEHKVGEVRRVVKNVRAISKQSIDDSEWM